MDRHEWGDRYEMVIPLIEEHIQVSKDGLLLLDVEDGSTIGIYDPIAFADLKRSLEITNERILQNEISIDDVAPQRRTAGSAS